MNQASAVLWARAAMNVRRRKVPPQFFDQLGKVPDHAIAKQHGVSTHMVRNARVKRGVPAFGPVRAKIHWTAESIGMLGRYSDGTVAKMLGISKAAVFHKRRSLNKLSAVPSRGTTEVHWSIEMLSALRESSDRQVADRFGIGLRTVRVKRQSLGIAAAPRGKPRPVVWTPKMIEDLRRMPRYKFARKYHLDYYRVLAKWKELGLAPIYKPAKFSPAMVALLGKRSDSRLARSFHMSASQIRQERRRLGIPGFRPRETFDESTFTPAMNALLGKRSDASLARSFHLSVHQIRNQRIKLGIPTYQPSGRWDETARKLLGTMIDRELAKRMGITQVSVNHMRRKLGIPCFGAEPIQKAEPTLPANQIAKKLGVHDETVKRWIYRGALPAVKLPNGHWRVKVADFEAFRRARTSGKVAGLRRI